MTEQQKVLYYRMMDDIKNSDCIPLVVFGFQAQKDMGQETQSVTIVSELYTENEVAREILKKVIKQFLKENK